MSWTLFFQIIVLILLITLMINSTLSGQARRASALFKEARDGE